MPKSMTSIIYGKLELHSDSASVDELKKHLYDILEKRGYPEIGLPDMPVNEIDEDDEGSDVVESEPDEGLDEAPKNPWLTRPKDGK